MNVKYEISHDEVLRKINERYDGMSKSEPTTGLDGEYEILPHDSPKIKKIKEYNRQLRQTLYAELNRIRKNKKLHE